MADEPERLYTVREAAAVLRCSVSTVYREVAAERLTVKRGMGKTLISASALQAFIDGLDDTAQRSSTVLRAAP